MWFSTAPARLSAVLLLLPMVHACAAGPPPGGAFAAGASETEVRVFNDRWEDLTVYLVREDMYIRLGKVTGKTSNTLTIPRQHAQSFGWMTLVAAHPDRKPHASSAEFQLQVGERARWTIELYSGPSPVVY